MASNNNNVIVTISAKDEATKVFQGLNQSLVAGVAAGNLLADTIKNAVGGAFNFLKGTIAESAQIQQSSITAASSIAALTGKSFSDAGKLVDELNNKLADAAASLPGTTQGYKDIALGISDNLIPAFTDASGVLDERSFVDGLEDITVGLGVLGAASNVAASDVSKFTAKFLGGSSMSELKNLMFAEANPAFLAIVEKKLSESGKKLEELTAKERATILQAVQNELVTDDVIFAASNSVSGMWEGFKSSLFDQTSGIFGLMRDLDEDMEGNQSVFASLQRVMMKIFGSDGVITNLNRILQELGIEVDPMEGLANGLGKIGGWLDSLNRWLSTLSLPDLQNLFSGEGIGFRLSQYFSGVLNRAFGFLSNLNDGATVEGIADRATNLLKEGLQAVFTNIAGILVSTDWGDVVSGIIGLFRLGFALLRVPARALFDFIIEGIQGWIALIGQGINNLKDRFVERFSGVINLVTNAVDAVKNAWQSVRSVFDSRWNGVKTAVNNFVGRITSAINNVTSFINRIPGVNIPTVGNASVGNSYAGMNFSSLLNAAQRELNNAPGGSNLVVANDSEIILNRAQQSTILSALNGRREAINFNVGGITVNSQNGNPQQIADEVMRVISREYARFSQSYSTAPVI
ncbi:hypothetical protein [Picosynechococcus sp. PCC 7117]|uniref:phage tail protein n=1 Tax=Picosynechococcus sp. PCC 7117 TaxID=195498 RepID=UPI000810D0B8|nr:hypothetical protein [Picosynechococcus sp. PCC 7117]ANV88497.1 hypothetical protein AWQ22_14075 [Picosynechococcus sp. PCC 7117]